MAEATPSGTLRTQGKEVLLNGQHLADARDEATAEAIALALDFVGVGFFDIPRDATRKIIAVLADG
jgi:hypothetical protein